MAKLVHDALTVLETNDLCMRALVKVIKDIDINISNYDLTNDFINRINQIIQQNMKGKYSLYNNPQVHEALGKYLGILHEIFEMENPLTDSYEN